MRSVDHEPSDRTVDPVLEFGHARIVGNPTSDLPPVTTVPGVWFPVFTLALILMVVVCTGGSFERLVHIPVRSSWLLMAGLALQIGLEYTGFPTGLVDTVGYALLMLSYALILAFCFTNLLRIPGFGVVVVGVMLNAVVIGLNQGMPAKDEPVRTASGQEVLQPIERTVKYRPKTDDTLLPFLSDIIRFPEPFDQTTVSFGDLVIAIGLADVAYHGSRRTRRRISPQTAARGTPRRSSTSRTRAS